MAEQAPLAHYRQRRDFTRTGEPSGRSAVLPSRQRRFVIQKHAATRLHYDLRLELDGVFKSWAVTKGPSLEPTDKRLAVEVEDHPLDYGDFEGTIPKGQYGGGTVQLWDRGYWTLLGTNSAEAALKEGDLKFILRGKRLHGSWVLVRIKSDRAARGRVNWLLMKKRDQFARPGDGRRLLDLDRSVASGRTMAQIAAGRGRAPMAFMLAPDAAPKLPAVAQSTVAQSKRQALHAMPMFIEPQLCKLVSLPPAAPGWAHEVKFDGYRMQLRVLRGEARLRTRSGADWTWKFTAIAACAAKLADCILDGEVCALDSAQMPSFAALQAALSEDRSGNLVFFAFDLLMEGNQDLRPLPLADRKHRLKALLAKAHVAHSIRYVEHFESTADTVLRSACRMHLEGIVSKRLDAPYVSGRSGSWTKAKCRAGQEVVIGGWTTQSGRLRSLLAGVHRDGHLIYVGRIGTGYGAATMSALLPKLKALTRAGSPFEGANAPRQDAGIRWLKPTLVAEIEFAGWTAAGMVRQASFKGLRRDKPASAVVADDVPDRKATAKVKAPAATVRLVLGVTVTRPDKVFWPAKDDRMAVTKLDLAHYYEAVGPWLLPHLQGRPCSLLRAPDGITGQRFFQRHASAGISSLFTLVKVKGDSKPYVQIDRIEALVAAAQTGALEIHPWNGAPNDPEVAGRLVFDLDPAPDVEFRAVIAAALEVRERLKQVGLESFCKTSGGKGLHVVSPLAVGRGAVRWPVAKDFAHVICAQMASDSPTRYLDTMSKRDRAGRVFLDYLRNDRTATAVAVLSPRARPGAPISMPLHWNEVKPHLDPSIYTVQGGAALLRRSKPWGRYFDSARSLAHAIRAVTGGIRGRSPEVGNT